MKLKFLDDPEMKCLGDYVPLYCPDDRLVVRVTGRDHVASVEIAESLVTATNPPDQPTSSETAVQLEKQVASLKREILMRKNVYPKWVKAGRMKQAEADREIDAMTAALHTVLSLQPSS